MENAPAIHSSSGAFLLAVFGFYWLLTAFACYGIAGRLSLSYSAVFFGSRYRKLLFASLLTVRIGLGILFLHA